MSFHKHPLDLLAHPILRHGTAIILCGVAGLIGWSLLPHPAKSNGMAAVNPAVTAPRRDSVALGQKIASAHLFGINPADTQSAGPAQPAADIKVQGLLYSSDKDSGLAILEIDGKSDVFKVGDSLPDGEKLLAVGTTAIQVGNGGAPRIIELQQDDSSSAAGILIAGAGNLDPGAGDPLLSGLPGRAPAAVFVQRLQTVSIPQNGDPIAEMRALRQQLIKH